MAYILEQILCCEWFDVYSNAAELKWFDYPASGFVSEKFNAISTEYC